LTINRELRGCIGALEATHSLAEDVRVHAVAAALDDYRFPVVREEEISKITIEISRLTTPNLLEYDNPEELLAQIRPGVDGVVLKQGVRRATFLPQVWVKIPEVEVFLSMLYSPIKLRNSTNNHLFEFSKNPNINQCGKII
jgi:AmmeMemoRadiSam system protein A